MPLWFRFLHKLTKQYCYSMDHSDTVYVFCICMLMSRQPISIYGYYACFFEVKKSIVCTYSLCFIMNRHIVQSLIVICLLFMCSIHKWPQRLFSFITTYPYQDNKDYTCVYTVDIGFFSEEV